MEPTERNHDLLRTEISGFADIVLGCRKAAALNPHPSRFESFRFLFSQFDAVQDAFRACRGRMILNNRMGAQPRQPGLKAAGA